LNEGKLSKADRDIIDAVGRQLLRSATSINANINEAQHPQSDAEMAGGQVTGISNLIPQKFQFH